MGYHTNFYACDPEQQQNWAKKILTAYKKQLKKRLNKIPSDKFFKEIYKNSMEMASDERYQEFHDNAKKYNWNKYYVADEEKWFQEHRDPNFTWEDEKKKYIKRLDILEATGLLEFDDKNDYADFLIRNYHLFKNEFDDEPMDYEVHDGKIFSGEIYKNYYRVKGRYCESLWFNWEGVIEMVEDYVDVTSFDKTTHEYTKMRQLTDEEKSEIENFFNDYEDAYCWVV